MRMNDSLYYLWLSLRLGAGSRAAVKLVRTAGSAKAVWEAPTSELASEAGVKPSITAKLHDERDLFDCEDILSWCAERGVAVLTPDLAEYPKSLLSLMDYPMVLFCAGHLPDLNQSLCTAVVGTRKMTDYGKSVAYNIGYGLGDGGAIVVSGLALGIDGMAMAGAQSTGAPTVGVLGCGIDVTYPAAHRELYRKTALRGAVITEYPPGTPPSGTHFPVRNRIISGLCQATVVVEADMRSGALITAKHALFQGRMVFAVPGNVGETSSEGTNSLLANGAKPALHANDILSEFEYLYPHSVKLSWGAAPKGGADAAKDFVHTPSSKKKKLTGADRSGSADGNAEKSPSERFGKRTGELMRRSSAKQPVYDPGKSGKIKPEPAASEESASAEVPRHLDFLGEKERAVYGMMKPDVPMLPDEIAGGELSVSEVMAAMTVLEIAGAVESGAGGYFIRCSNRFDVLGADEDGESADEL